MTRAADSQGSAALLFLEISNRVLLTRSGTQLSSFACSTRKFALATPAPSQTEGGRTGIVVIRIGTLASAEEVARYHLAMNGGVAEIRLTGQRAPMIQMHVMLPREADTAVDLNSLGGNVLRHV
jgi:hypothetical protein